MGSRRLIQLTHTLTAINYLIHDLNSASLKSRNLYTWICHDIQMALGCWWVTGSSELQVEFPRVRLGACRSLNWKKGWGLGCSKGVELSLGLAWQSSRYLSNCGSQTLPSPSRRQSTAQLAKRSTKTLPKKLVTKFNSTINHDLRANIEKANPNVTHYTLRPIGRPDWIE